ncbi:hypothetical protein ABY58_09770 [Edwardsiella ictaluri]|nr:hypothetical protein ABY58_09770 [Edwardsiella ictaluri]
MLLCAIPVRLQRPLPALAGRSLTLGIRPEHLRRVSAAQGETGNALTIDTLELLGADNLAHGRTGARALGCSGRHRAFTLSGGAGHRQRIAAGAAAG